MKTKHIRKLATVAATAALTLQLFAGASAAAVPNAEEDALAYGNNGTNLSAGQFGGNGYAGFSSRYAYADGSTLAKLYVEADITGGSSVPVLIVTKNGDAVNGCSVQQAPLAVTCLFKTVRTGDVFVLDFGVLPTGTTVSTEIFWSSTGYVVGGNNSHGDAWTSGELTSSLNPDANFAAGFGNAFLATQTSGNNQSAKLTGLPSGKYASVNDAGGDLYFGFPEVDIVVNDGDPADFQLAITYPKNTQSPNGYLHITDGASKTYFLCQKGAVKESCFDWDKKTATATLYLEHNGSLRRTS